MRINIWLVYKSHQKFDIKIDGIQSGIQKFWYMSGIQANKNV